MNRCPKCQAFTKPFIQFGRCQKCQGLIIGDLVVIDQEPKQRPKTDVTPAQITFLFSDDLKETVCIIPDEIKTRLSRFGYEEHDLMNLMLYSFFDEMEVFHAQK